MSRIRLFRQQNNPPTEVVETVSNPVKKSKKKVGLSGENATKEWIADSIVRTFGDLAERQDPLTTLEGARASLSATLPNRSEGTAVENLVYGYRIEVSHTLRGESLRLHVSATGIEEEPIERVVMLTWKGATSSGNSFTPVYAHIDNMVKEVMHEIWANIYRTGICTGIARSLP